MYDGSINTQVSYTPANLVLKVYNGSKTFNSFYSQDICGTGGPLVWDTDDGTNCYNTVYKIQLSKLEG